MLPSSQNSEHMHLWEGTEIGLLISARLTTRWLPRMVRNRAGEWISAVPIPGTFFCNIGDMLKIWSNGIYECTLHRMINNSPTYHVSIAFFYEPNFDACIDPVNFCKEKVNGVATVEKAVYGEHLVKKVLTNFGMLITVLVLQEAIKGVVSEFEIPKGEDQSQPLYQFQWLYTNGLLAVIFSYGLVFTALKSRGARSWRYGTGHDNKQPKGSNRGVQKILPIEIPSMLLADLNRMTNNFGLKALIGEVTEF